MAIFALKSDICFFLRFFQVSYRYLQGTHNVICLRRIMMIRLGVTPMGKNERTGSRVGKIASKLLREPASATVKQIKTIAASALTQRPDYKKPTKRK